MRYLKLTKEQRAIKRSRFNLALAKLQREDKAKAAAIAACAQRNAARNIQAKTP